MSKKSDCLICGAPIIYQAQSRNVPCSLCNTPNDTQTQCKNGHFVCDACHSIKSNDWILESCIQSKETNPFKLAIRLMNHPSIKMHGPEHHFLVPAVLLTGYFTLTGNPGKIPDALKNARSRSEKVPGGFCGFCGNCGAAVGTGIFMSVVLEATPLSTNAWRLCNKMTSNSLSSVADHGGPRCCKRDTFLSIQSAIDFCAEHLGVIFETAGTPVCGFSHLNKECLHHDCIYFAAKAITD